MKKFCVEKNLEKEQLIIISVKPYKDLEIEFQC